MIQQLYPLMPIIGHLRGFRISLIRGLLPAPYPSLVSRPSSKYVLSKTSTKSGKTTKCRASEPRYYCIITIVRYRSQSISVLIMRLSLVLSLVSLSTSSAFVHQRSIIVQPQTSFSLTNHNVIKLPTISYSNNVVKFSSTARKESAVPGLIMDGSKLLHFVLYLRLTIYISVSISFNM